MPTTSTAVSTQPEPELVGQTVVVIGGSAGIGLETARRARVEGADIIPNASSKLRWSSGRKAPRPSTPTTRLRCRGSSGTCQPRSTM
jgi:hypothetical protein